MRTFFRLKNWIFLGKYWKFFSWVGKKILSRNSFVWKIDFLVRKSVFLFEKIEVCFSRNLFIWVLQVTSSLLLVAGAGDLKKHHVKIKFHPGTKGNSILIISTN